MPPFRVIDAVALSLVVILPLAAGCAKRPVTATTTAPAPTGGAATPQQPGAPRAVASPGMAPSTRGGPTPPRSGTAAPGAPATRPVPREFMEVPEVKDVQFDFDKYEIRPGDARILDDNGRWMKANPAYLVLVEGHADERGTNEYNLALGERRAKAAMNYLIAQGVPAGRLTIISYGEERPVCQEKAEACWARNRRAHFLVKPQ